MYAATNPVPDSVTDPFNSSKFKGKSAQHLAKPVSLPFERSLRGSITNWVLMAVDGKGPKEYYLQFHSLPADGYRYAQRRGRASQGMKPMWLLVNKVSGEGLGLMLAYMGNWTFQVSPKGQNIVVELATSPSELEPFEKIGGLPVPGALVSEFTGHWDYGAQPLVRFIREKLLRDMGSDWPPVQYNTWYDLYDQITEERLVKAAGVAKEVGCELFTIDAGWFGNGLDAKWSKTIGDWEVNRARLLGGMEVVSKAVHQLGMKFGLWFEIECAAPDSRLAAEHPDWFLKGTDGRALSKRGMLDFGKPEVLSHAKQVLDDAVTRYSLDYIKMDFNTDPAIENQDLKPAEDPLYRHYRGMAELWKHIRAKHPRLIVEDCSSGARRHELTSAALTDTHWISDTVGNGPNLLIMFGATYFFPATTCSHWTTKPDPQDPVMDLQAQFLINTMGHLGLSGAIASWDSNTLAIAKQSIAEYKRLRPLLRTADVYHLTTPQIGSHQAALYVEPNTHRGLLFAFQAGASSLSGTVPLRGLEPGLNYVPKVLIGAPETIQTGEPWSGKEIMKTGLKLAFPHSGAAVLIELEPSQRRTR